MDELDEFFANLEVEAKNSKPPEIPSLDRKIIESSRGIIVVEGESVGQPNQQFLFCNVFIPNHLAKTYGLIRIKRCIAVGRILIVVVKTELE